MKKKCAGGNAGMQNGDEEAQKEWDAKGEVHILRVVQAGDNFGVQYTVDKRGNGKNKSDERARSADVKECAGRANRRTNQNECAESADERGERNEKRITGADVVMTTSEEVSEFVGEKNGEQSESERQTGGEGGRVLVKKPEGFDKLVQRNGLVLRIGDGELSASDEAGAKSEEEKNAREIEGLERRWRRDGDISRLKECNGAPIEVDGDGRRRIFWERIAHEVAGAKSRVDTNQYSTSGRVRASFERGRN